MRLLFALLLVIALITVVTDTRAGVVVEPAYDENQLDWVDPNGSTKDFTQFYTSQHGLTCENQIYQIYHLGAYVPARKCQLPDGAWFTEPL